LGEPDVIETLRGFLRVQSPRNLAAVSVMHEPIKAKVGQSGIENLRAWIER
jgi:hypothetical protein